MTGDGPDVAGSARPDGYEADGSEVGVRAVDPQVAPGELAEESALRPRSLAEFVGQPVVRRQLGLVLEAARRRGGAPDHVLLAGPRPG